MPTLMIEEILNKSSNQWTECEADPEKRVLRYYLLRTLSRALHAEKSSAITIQDSHQASHHRDLLQSYEKRIELLRESDQELDKSLLELLRSGETPPKIKRTLPGSLFNAVDREKFERFDRYWERVITYEALHRGWTLWHLDANIEFKQVESWSQALAATVWPNAIPLFAETVTTTTPPAGIWPSRWYLLLRPGIPEPTQAELSPQLGLSKLSWKKLYSPETSHEVSF